MKLYNTLTRRKEEFVPVVSGVVSMYSCGPTVYSFAHIGNMRTYIFMDILRRALTLNGFRVNGVMNVTDVGHLMSDRDEGEDKMARAAREQKKTPAEIAEFYTSVFMRDLSKLNIGMPETVPKATDHIAEMLAFVSELLKKGYAYEIGDGVYFDISKFSGYGKLSGIDLDEQQAGARVEVNPEKRNAADFALWKKAEPEHIMQWDSPWGRGYPGWHIECSAMSRKYLGRTFDIHTGGVDHIPIHHENEIAQSEALEGKKTVNFWMHGEFMLVDNGKMSKSLKNTYTVDDLERRGYHPLDFRYLCLNAHYRKKLNFTFSGLDGAKTARARLNALVCAHKAAPAVAAPQLQRYTDAFNGAINDDLNVPYALGMLWNMLKDEPPNAAVYERALYFDRIFGLSLNAAEADVPAHARGGAADVPPAILALAEKRRAARAAKNWGESDTLRTEIESAGWRVIDKPDGYDLLPAAADA